MTCIKHITKQKSSDRRRNTYSRMFGTVLTGEEVLQLCANNPEHIVGVKSSRIYTQIAKSGRTPELRSSRIALTSALADAREIRTSNGQITVGKEPPYVPMKMKDVKTCFGNDISRMPKTSFIALDEPCVKCSNQAT